VNVWSAAQAPTITVEEPDTYTPKEDLQLLADALRFGGQLVSAVPDELCTEIFEMSDEASFRPEFLTQGDWGWEFIKGSSRKVRAAMARKVRRHLRTNMH
jgi:nicotinamidase-related amidase